MYVIKAFGSKWKYISVSGNFYADLNFATSLKQSIKHSNVNLIRKLFIEHKFVAKDE